MTERFSGIMKILNAWSNLYKEIISQIKSLPNTKLKSKISQELPAVDPTILSAITFQLQHQFYHPDQLGYVRRYFSFDVVNYF